MSLNHVSRLGLGTAQFGLSYGITNEVGRLDEREVAAILKRCADEGVRTVDTASAYGESETVLGRLGGEAAFDIVTKAPRIGTAASNADAVGLLRTAFRQSLVRLRRSAVYGLLLHSAGDLLGPYGNSLWAALEELKAKGLVRAIGVSVYEGTEIDRVIERYPIDLIQLPWNPLDTRLEKGGQLARLASKNVAVHARSLFLQGLLLQPPDRIPNQFAPIRVAVTEMDRCFEQAGVSRLRGIFAIAFARVEIAKFIVGVTSLSELKAIIDAARDLETGSRIPLPDVDLDPVYLNPARWNELA